MPHRTPVLAAVIAAAVAIGGVLPAAASAAKPADPGKSASAGSSAPVVTGRPDADSDGRKNR